MNDFSPRIDFRFLSEPDMIAAGVTDMPACVDAMEETLALAIGPDRLVSPGGISPEEAGPPLFFTFVAEHLGTLWVDIMSLLFITSLFAALVSFHNAVARYSFALARESILPAPLARVRDGVTP